MMEHLLDYIRCVAFIFLLSFKPSEPHLTRYLTTEKRFTDDEVNDSIYPVCTYTSVLLMSMLALAKYIGFRDLKLFMNDRELIWLGCCGRVATRLLLLFASSLPMMQLMQVTYTLGFVAEIAFYAYCLKVVPPEKTQQLTAFVQASYFGSHTLAGILGDFLLRSSSIGLYGLMVLSACSVMTAALVALTLRSVDADVPLHVDRPQAVLRLPYQTCGFLLSALWWVLSYSVYYTVYSYESSIYAEFIAGGDNNGTIFAIGVFAGCASALLLSVKAVELFVASCTFGALVTAGVIAAASVAIMGWFPKNEWALSISFAIFFMAWSFANTLFYGETRRVVDTVLQEDTSMVTEVKPGKLDTYSHSSIMSERLVSTIFIMHTAAGNVVNGLSTFILFTWLALDVDAAFQCLAVAQGFVSLLLLLLWAVTNVQHKQDMSVPMLRS